MSYPKMLHRSVGTFRMVASAAAEAALNPRLWPASPLCWGLLTAPSVAQWPLDVTTIAPVHGRPVAWSDFEKAMGAAANLCQTVGAGGSVAWAPCK